MVDQSACRIPLLKDGHVEECHLGIHAPEYEYFDEFTSFKLTVIFMVLPMCCHICISGIGSIGVFYLCSKQKTNDKGYKLLDK